MSTWNRRRGIAVAATTAAIAVAASVAAPAIAGEGRQAPEQQAQSAAAPPADKAPADTKASAMDKAKADTKANTTAAVDYDTWQRDVQVVVDKAHAYVDDRTAEQSGEKRAIVLDIDNTSLETHFSPLPPTPAIKSVKDLTRFADSRGVDIFFVTARPGFIDWVTEWNLEDVGYPVDGLYGRALEDLFEPVETYKTRMRTEIERKGYTVIANIGNNTTDLQGGHAERTFKLPDYDGQLS